MFVNTAGTESSQFSTLNYVYCFLNMCKHFYQYHQTKLDDYKLTFGYSPIYKGKVMKNSLQIGGSVIISAIQ